MYSRIGRVVVTLAQHAVPVVALPQPLACSACDTNIPWLFPAPNRDAVSRDSSFSPASSKCTWSGMTQYARNFDPSSVCDSPHKLGDYALGYVEASRNAAGRR